MLLGVSMFLVSFSPLPKIDMGEANIFYAQPLVMRAASNISHTLVADLLWLSTSDVGELTERKQTVDESVAMAQSIVVMDPCFSTAIHYNATYLAAMKGAVREGAALYATAGWFVKDDFQLSFNEMVLRLTYEEPLDNERIVLLAKKLMRLPEKTRYLGAVEYREMVEGMMYYAASREQREAKKRENLFWLFKHSSNTKRREEIGRQLGFRE